MSTINISPAATSFAGEHSHDTFVDPSDLRTTFTMALSAMYRNEVPLYGDLIRIVQDINRNVLAHNQQLSAKEVPQRLDIERHGAIRLGTPYELRTVSRIFSMIGLEPVGYYDLSVAGLPMHATCFRPVKTSDLEKNPFRIFTTLLRPELLKDEEARELALRLLARRNIFSPALLDLLAIGEKQSNQLTARQAEDFVVEAMKTFSWQPTASASQSEYKKLASEHPILADIASFKSCHINHLTPRTLDIAASQQRMKVEGLQVKDDIEGPPQRQCPILLRQTSFLALEERIKFYNSDGELVEGKHRARFGEVEERGAAVTPAGRKLYDELLASTMSRFTSTDTMDQLRSEVFSAYPDDWETLRKRGLIYCTYTRTEKPFSESFTPDAAIEELISENYLIAEPITYEDFLPFSAAGIFQSNLGKSESGISANDIQPDQEGFERDLGRLLLSSDDLYAEQQRLSLMKCALRFE